MRNDSYLRQRALESAKYLISNKATIRETATHIGCSKSAIHYGISKILPEVSYTLYKQVKKVLDSNYDERGIRGGMATKAKWSRKKVSVNERGYIWQTTN